METYSFSQWPRWWPAAAGLVLVALSVRYYGYELITVRKDGLAMAPILRGIFARGGWLAVYGSAVGGSLGWVFRSALIQGGGAAFGTVASFAVTWLATNTAATLVFVISRNSVADAMNAQPGPGRNINAFIRRWSIPLVTLVGIVPPPFPMTFVLFMIATAKMPYARFCLPYAAGTAIGIGINIHSGGSALLDPDLPMSQIVVLLILPLFVVPIAVQVGKWINHSRRSRSN